MTSIATMLPKFEFYGFRSPNGHFYASHASFMHEEGYWDGLSGDKPQNFYYDDEDYVAGYRLGRKERFEKLYEKTYE